MSNHLFKFIKHLPHNTALDISTYILQLSIKNLVQSNKNMILNKKLLSQKKGDVKIARKNVYLSLKKFNYWSGFKMLIKAEVVRSSHIYKNLKRVASLILKKYHKSKNLYRHQVAQAFKAKRLCRSIVGFISKSSDGNFQKSLGEKFVLMKKSLERLNEILDRKAILNQMLRTKCTCN